MNSELGVDESNDSVKDNSFRSILFWPRLIVESAHEWIFFLLALAAAAESVRLAEAAVDVWNLIGVVDVKTCSGGPMDPGQLCVG